MKQVCTLLLCHYEISELQLRQRSRRLAFNVPHRAQWLYIVRANQLVMIALEPSIRIITAALKSVSFKL